MIPTQTKSPAHAGPNTHPKYTGRRKQMLIYCRTDEIDEGFQKAAEHIRQAVDGIQVTIGQALVSQTVADDDMSKLLIETAKWVSMLNEVRSDLKG